MTTLFQLLIVLCTSLLLAAAPFSAAAEEPNCPFGLTANDIAASSGLDLAGKTCLVTGGRSGLGYAVAEALLWQNCTVVIASRNLEKNQEAVKSLKATVGPAADVSYMTFDLEDFHSIQEFATSFTSNHTQLDYYFANAGQGGSGAQPLTVDGYERIFQVNYVGQFLLLQLLLPLIRESQPSRIILTGSSTHSMSCGTVGMSTGNIDDDNCFDETSDNNLISMLPFDETGLGKINHTFQCPPLNGPYPITKHLFIHLAKELSKREAEAGNEVYAYSWAPGSIKTNLNPWAFCCSGPFEKMGTDTCHYILPFVGPTDDEGNPDEAAYSDHWVSSAHGAMSGLYAALHAAPEETGTFFATYFECENDKGLYLQGLTPQGREQLYEDSMVWAGLAKAQDTDKVPASGDVAEEEGEMASSGGYHAQKQVAVLTSLAGVYAML